MLDNLKLKDIPISVKYATEDMTRGLSKFISIRYSNKLPIANISNAFTKLWEILLLFNIASPENYLNTEEDKGKDKGKGKGVLDNVLRVFHICEAPGQMILAFKYFVKNKCKHITDMQWVANSLNPYSISININTIKYGKPLGDSYDLIKNNPTKWLWGSDNTGDITNVNNIKWFKNYINTKFLTPNNNKLHLIIGDGGLGTGNNTLSLQKLDLAQVIMVLACSSIGGSCIIKHFTPYMTNHPETINATSFFISFLYLYYVTFEEVIFFKPYSSNMDSGEFYVIGKGFKGITKPQLENLYEILDNFKVNNSLIDKKLMPDNFILQITSFINIMTNYNIKGIEKTNLLLNCYKLNNITNITKSSNKKNNYNKKKILQCDVFLNNDNIENILVPRYNQWLKITQFI